MTEPITPGRAWARKVRTLATVAWRQRATPRPEELSEKASDLCRRAGGERSLPRQIQVLWQVESLVFALADRHFAEINLHEQPLPLEAGPPAHCGLSMATVLEAGFTPQRLAEMLEERSNPQFIDFAFETLGLMAAAYEPDVFGRITDFLGRAGLMRRYRIEPRDPREFLEGLPERWQAFAAHGYGRLLYFKSHRFGDAVRRIEARSFLPFAPAVKGVVAAWVLVNSRDAGRILAWADGLEEENLATAVSGGLENVLTLLEWSIPGRVAALEAKGPRAREILARAVTNAAARRGRGEGPGLIA